MQEKSGDFLANLENIVFLRTLGPWLMGGATFTDGSTTIGVATLTSATANFVTEDVGKVIVSDNFPPGTTIVSRTSSTVVQTSAAATKTPTKKPVAFSILTRNPGGAAFRVLTAPDQGVILIGKPRFCGHCRKEVTRPFSTERTAQAVWLLSKSTTCRNEPETSSRPGTLAENVAPMAKRFRILTRIASEERGRPESLPVKSRSHN